MNEKCQMYLMAICIFTEHLHVHDATSERDGIWLPTFDAVLRRVA